MNLNITAYSTALFSTWINVEQLNLLIDAGDGLTAGLLQKSRKIKNVFITHSDRDHLNGLPQFVQLNSRKNYPIIHYPKDSGSFPAMRDFLTKFDPHVSGSQWRGIEAGQEIKIRPDLVVQALRNEHIKCDPGVHKSFSYKVQLLKNKLKKEFIHLTNDEIGNLAKKIGRDQITEETRTNIISFSGDTPIDDYDRWDKSEILIHEATFLKNEIDDILEAKGHKHTKIEELLKMASEIELGTLIINHFSTRYSRGEIDDCVSRLLQEYRLDIPIYLVYPGEIKRNILAQDPFNC